MKNEISIRLKELFEGIGELIYSLLEDIALKLWKLSVQ
jgi:hypothetical protein